MHLSNLQFEIQNEQQNRLTAAVEAFLISFMAIISAILLPQIIFDYFMQNGEFTQAQSEFLANIPTGAYAIAAFFFVYALIGNYLRGRKIRQLRRDIELMQYAFDEADLSQLETESAPELKSSQTSKKKATSTSKKTASASKSTAKKSTAKKSSSRRSSKK